MDESMLKKNRVARYTAFAGAFALILAIAPAWADDQGGPPHPPGENTQVYSDPLAPFNEKMFTFNLKLDHYILHPVAQGYADIAPVSVRESVGRFFNNINFIPRMANNLFQLHFPEAGGELARFGINTTIGIGGVFDPADKWFGLQQHDNDMGLTLGHYGVPSGYYLVLPFLGPGTIRDDVGMAADGAMWPLSYFVPWYIYIPAGAGKTIIQAVNYRSLHLDLFEQVDRYAVDLYGAVQDGYMQRRANELETVNQY
ncbi:MAG TPA: VacJ family lipoprotein [Candidatus Binataceae bacterium]|jgi:phospholipid-binding lipoprotein MlaA|nr:VacJ family lipoprotein [Candidatus Binataceae bacterium]